MNIKIKKERWKGHQQASCQMNFHHLLSWLIKGKVTSCLVILLMSRVQVGALSDNLDYQMTYWINSISNIWTKVLKKQVNPSQMSISIIHQFQVVRFWKIYSNHLILRNSKHVVGWRVLLSMDNHMKKRKELRIKINMSGNLKKVRIGWF